MAGSYYQGAMTMTANEDCIRDILQRLTKIEVKQTILIVIVLALTAIVVAESKCPEAVAFIKAYIGLLAHGLTG